MSDAQDLKELKHKLAQCKTEIFDKQQVYEWMKFSYGKGRMSK